MIRRAGQQILGRAVDQQPPVGDDHGARTDGLHLFEDMGGDDDRLVGRHFADQVADLVFLVGVEAVGRLVHDQNFRVVDHRLGQPDAALEPLRQGFDGLAEDFPQIDLVDDVVDAAAFFQPVEATHLGDETQV